jgi:hypothetical protein
VELDALPPASIERSLDGDIRTIANRSVDRDNPMSVMGWVLGLRSRKREETH